MIKGSVLRTAPLIVTRRRKYLVDAVICRRSLCKLHQGIHPFYFVRRQRLPLLSLPAVSILNQGKEQLYGNRIRIFLYTRAGNVTPERYWSSWSAVPVDHNHGPCLCRGVQPWSRHPICRRRFTACCANRTRRLYLDRSEHTCAGEVPAVGGRVLYVYWSQTLPTGWLDGGVVVPPLLSLERALTVL